MIHEVEDYSQKYKDYKDYIAEYFAVKTGEKNFDPSKLHFYESKPAEGTKELTEDVLKKVLVYGRPVFVTYGENKNAVAFMDKDNKLYSGPELANEIRKDFRKNQRPDTSAAPKPVAAPGFVSNFLYKVFGYQTSGFRAYNQYLVTKTLYESALAKEDSLQISQHLDESAVLRKTQKSEEKEVLKEAEVPKKQNRWAEAEAAVQPVKSGVGEDGNFKIGDAAPADPKVTGRRSLDAAEELENREKAAEKFITLKNYLEQNEKLGDAFYAYMRAEGAERDALRSNLHHVFMDTSILRPTTLGVGEMIYYADRYPERFEDYAFASEKEKASEALVKEDRIAVIVDTIAKEIIKESPEGEQTDPEYIKNTIKNGEALARMVGDGSHLQDLSVMSQKNPKMLKQMYVEELKSVHAKPQAKEQTHAEAVKADAKKSEPVRKA